MRSANTSRSPESTKVSFSPVSPRLPRVRRPAGRRLIGELGVLAEQLAHRARPDPRHPRPCPPSSTLTLPRPSTGRSTSTAAGTAWACTTDCTARAQRPGRRPRSGPTAAQVGHRVQPEHRLGDDRERAERPDQQLAQVVACDVLHHSTAGLGDDAVRADHRDPDEQVARGARPVPAADRRRSWPACRRCWRRARSRRARAAAPACRRMPAASASRAPAWVVDDQVAGLVVEHLVHRADVDDARRPSWAACPTTSWCRGPRDHGQPVRCRGPEHLGDLLGRASGGRPGPARPRRRGRPRRRRGRPRTRR